MSTKYVTFEQAKWLFEKGFDNIECDGYYHINEGYTTGYAFCHSERDEQFDNSILSPEQHQVVEWLRVNYNIMVSCLFKETDESFMYQIHKMKSEELPRIFTNDGFNLPQEAYSAAFDYIKENNLI